VTATEFDAVGNPTATVDARGNRAEYAYDELNRLQKVTQPEVTLADGTRVRPEARYRYDTAGNLVSVTDPRGNVTTYAYDRANRLVVRADASSQVTRAAWSGAVLTLSSPLGNETITYDSLGHVTVFGSSLPGVTSTEYDRVGNRTATVDARGNRTDYGYDELNRLSEVRQSEVEVFDHAHVSQLRPEISYGYDAVGNLVSVTDPLGNVSTYGYDKANRLEVATDALSHSTRNEYDGVGNRVASVDARGNRTEYEYDELNRLTTVTQPEVDYFDQGTTGRVRPMTTYANDVVGNVVSVTDARRNIATYAYDMRNQLVVMADASSQVATAEWVGGVLTLSGALGTATFAYDAAGHVVRQSSTLPGVMNMEYDAVGNRTATVDALGRRTVYQYDALNRLQTRTDADPDGPGSEAAPTTIWAYDPNGNVTRMTDPNTNVTQYGYDEVNRRTERIDATGHSSFIEYDGVGNVIRTTDALGRETLFEYDSSNRLVRRTDPDPDAGGPGLSPVTRWEHDAGGNLTRVTDPLANLGDSSGNVTKYVYDELNRLIETIDALGNSSFIRYDEVGNVVRREDELHRTTSFQYDALNRLVKQTAPDPDAAGPALSPVTQWEVDANGNVTRMTDALGNQAEYSFDEVNRRIETIDAFGNSSFTEYDGVGNVVASEDELGRRTLFEYDGVNRLLKRTDPDPDGAGPAHSPVTRWEYDANGNLETVFDPLGNRTRYAHDALNRRTDVIDPNGDPTHYGYDAVGRLVSVTDALNNSVIYTYDDLSRLVKEKDPFNAEKRYAYDADSRLIEKVDALGRTTHSDYDALGRNIQETWRDASGNVVNTITRTFDAVGQLRKVVDAAATYTIDYDDLGRITGIDNAGSPSLTAVGLSYSYDAVGNVLQVSATIAGQPDWTTTYGYDKLNRVVQVVQAGGEAIDKHVTFVYDAAGELQTISRFGSGPAAAIVSTYAWDGDGRPSTITHANAGGSIADYTFAWDAASRLVGVTSTDGTAAFGYDAAGQLTSANYSYKAPETYGYDAAGNRIGSVLDSANRVLDDGTYTYTYDAEGNRFTRTDKTSGVVDTYTYDHRDRLVAVTSRDAAGNLIASETLRYDEFGWKIQRVFDPDGNGPATPQTEQYVYDGNYVTMILDGAAGGTANQLFLYGPGMDNVLAEQDGGQLRWLLSDHEQTVRDVTDAAGTPLDHIRYASFGAVTSQSNPSAAPRYGYTGREPDGISGMMDYRARWYDPALGRFLTLDPIGFAAGDPNLYRYVFNQPTDRVDPTGQKPKSMTETFMEYMTPDISAESQRNFAQWGDQYADYTNPIRRLIPSGPNAHPFWQMVRDVTNPALVLEQIAGGALGVAKSFVKVVTGIVDVVHDVGKALINGELGEWLADKLEGLQDRINAACGDVFKAVLTAGHDLKKFVGDTWKGLKQAAEDKWNNIVQKTLSGDTIGASSDIAETTADVAQVVVPIGASAISKVRGFFAATEGGIELAKGIEAATSVVRGIEAEEAAEAAAALARRPPTTTIWRGVYLTDAEAAQMSADLAAGRPILTNATRNGLSAAEWEAEALEWAQNQTGEREWIARASREEQLAAFHADGAGPNTNGISFTGNRYTAEEWAFEYNDDVLNKKQYLIRAEVEYTDDVVRQTGKSWGMNREYEYTLLGDTKPRSAGLYEITGAEDEILGGSTYRKVPVGGEGLGGGGELQISCHSPCRVHVGKGLQTATEAGVSPRSLVVEDVERYDPNLLVGSVERMPSGGRLEGSTYHSRSVDRLTGGAGVPYNDFGRPEFLHHFDPVSVASVGNRKAEIGAAWNALAAQVGFPGSGASFQRWLDDFGVVLTPHHYEYDAVRNTHVMQFVGQDLHDVPHTGSFSDAQVVKSWTAGERILPFSKLVALVPSAVASSRAASVEATGSLSGTRDALELARVALDAFSDASGTPSRPLIRVAIADLPAGDLGRAWITQLDAAGRPSEGRIVLDWNGDGHGWFIDPTPLDASEFSNPNSPAVGRYDLFSVIAHEVGHTLGFLYGYDGYDQHVVTLPDGTLSFQSATVRANLTVDGSHLAGLTPDLMSDSLGLFQRKLPSALAAAIVAASQGSASPSSQVSAAGAALGGDGVVNGRFDVSIASAAGFGWQIRGGASVENGQAVLAETSTLQSRFLQQLIAPEGVQALAFTLVNTHFDAPGDGPQDAFEVALIDPQTMQSLAGGMGLTNTDALLNLQADGMVYRADTVQLTATDGRAVQVRIELGGVNAGQALTLYFDLIGFGALGSRVAIDDVRFESGQPPVAQADSVETTEDTPLTFDPRDNDSSPSGLPLTIQLTSGAAHGAVFVGLDGRVTYTPAANYFGPDGFEYRLSDGVLTSLPVAVTINVVAVNDAPVASDVSATTAEDTPLAGTLSATDVDSPALTFTVVNGPAYGVLMLDPSGTFSYTPAADFYGADEFTYVANDGLVDSSVATMSLTVTPVNDAPDAYGRSATVDQGAVLNATLAATDIDSASLTYLLVDAPAHGAVVVNAGGTFTYTSDVSFHGGDEFTFRANDGSLDSNLATVTITVRDVTPPELTVPADQVAEATSAAGAVVTYPEATATEGGGAVTITYSQASGTLFPLGSTTVTVTATDTAANATTRSFTVTVRDATAPELTVPADRLAEAMFPAGAVVFYPPASATDAVGPITITYSHASGSVFALGTTHVLVRAADGALNFTERTFDVTVADTTPPVLVVPADQLAEATSPEGAVVFFPSASATDAVGPITIIYSQASGTVFAFGTTLVLVTATDGAGLSTTNSFRATVLDTTPPVLVVPADQIAEATSPAGADVFYPSATATDAVGPVSITYSYASGSVFALGTTQVVVRATDGALNFTERSFAVIVQDTTAPELTVPADQIAEATSSAGALATFPAASATDAVGPITITYSRASGSLFALGTTQVVVRATDGALNFTERSFAVIVRDTTPPELAVPADQLAEATSAVGAFVTYPPATATDAVGPVTITYSQASGSVFALGTTHVVVRATDAFFNFTERSFDLIVRDTTSPELRVPADQLAEATSPAGALVDYPAASATDAVGPVTITYSHVSGSLFPLGTTHVVVRATDAALNFTERSFDVVVRDTTAPVGTIAIAAGAEATPTPIVTVAVSFTDAVGVNRMRFSTDGGTTWTAWEAYAPTKQLTLPTPDGMKTVLTQVDDAAGNVGSASDSIALATTPPAITITPPGGGTCDLCTQYFLQYAVVSTFGIVSQSATLDGAAIENDGLIDTFYLGAGVHTIVVTATDVYGKTTSQSITFEVHATIEGLICAVERGVLEGLIAPEQRQPLLAKLYAAQASRDRSQVTPEINQLTAFIHDDQAQTGKKIQTNFADRLIGWTQDLIVRLTPRPSLLPRTLQPPG
jgi:RHS repeat-associated protein